MNESFRADTVEKAVRAPEAQQAVAQIADTLTGFEKGLDALTLAVERLEDRLAAAGVLAQTPPTENHDAKIAMPPQGHRFGSDFARKLEAFDNELARVRERPNALRMRLEALIDRLEV